MSRPVAVTNAWNSSTVTAFVDTANERPIITQCCGFANGAAPPSAPCLNRPAGSTVMAGQVGQSRITVPAVGTAGAEGTGIGAGTGARWTANQAITANTNTPALTPIQGRIAPGFQAARRLGAETSATAGPAVDVRSSTATESPLRVAPTVTASRPRVPSVKKGCSMPWSSSSKSMVISSTVSPAPTVAEG